MTRMNEELEAKLYNEWLDEGINHGEAIVRLRAYLQHARKLESQGRVIELRRFANWAGEEWRKSV